MKERPGHIHHTVYIGIAMVFVFPPYIREIQILLLVSSQFDF